MFLKQRFFTAEKVPPPNPQAISIAFLDTGISPVADFTQPDNRIIAFLDMVNGRTEPYDDNGHGTQLTVPSEPPTQSKKTIPACKRLKWSLIDSINFCA